MIVLKGPLVAALIVLGVADILVVAEGMAPEPRCPIDPWTTVFCMLTERETLAAGLLAAGGAIFAAWLAWVAVERQIAFQATQRRADQVAKQVTALHIAEDLLVSLAIHLGTDGIDKDDVNEARELLPMLRPLMPDLAATNPRLARSAGVLFFGVDGLKGVVGTFENFDEQIRLEEFAGRLAHFRRLAYHADLLDAACESTREAIEAGKRPDPFPIDKEKLLEIRSEHRISAYPTDPARALSAFADS